MENFKLPINLENIKPVEAAPGIWRKSLVYGDEGIMCHFRLEKDSKVPMHTHTQTQMGYVLSGKLLFHSKKGDFEVKAGDSYYFNGNEEHGADTLEETEVIDIFMPLRKEYMTADADYLPNKAHFI